MNYHELITESALYGVVSTAPWSEELAHSLRACAIEASTDPDTGSECFRGVVDYDVWEVWLIKGLR